MATPLPQPATEVAPDVRLVPVPAARRALVPYWAATAAVAVAAVFVNLYRLALSPLHFDEGFYIYVGWQYVHWGDQPAKAHASDNVYNNFEHAPLAKMLFGLGQLLAGGPSTTAARAVSALATLGAALVLGCWLGRAANRWVGLLAAGVFALMPMAVFPQVTRFGRAAMLDPVAGFFMVTALAVGWYWFRVAGARSWDLSVATGIAIGLAAASKENAFLGLVGPVLLGLWWAVRERDLPVRVAQGLLAAALSVATFLASYTPLGDPLGRVRFLWKFQTDHSELGHETAVAGVVTSHPPWWANLWFAQQGLGAALSWVLLLLAVAAVVLRRDRLVAWLGASLVAPFVFHSFIAGVILEFYWAMWLAPLVGLAALGGWELAMWVRRPARPWSRAIAGAGAGVALVVVAAACAGQVLLVARLQPEGAGAVKALRAELGLRKAILIAGPAFNEMQPQLLDQPIVGEVPADPATVDTVLLGKPRCGADTDSKVLAFIRVNVADGALQRVRSDRLTEVYAARSVLRAPTDAEVAAQTPITRTTAC